METNTTLSSLNLYYNNIGGEGATAIAKALETNTTLSELDLFENNIGDEGATAIAKALETNTTLSELNLYNNKIGDEARAVLKNIPTHKKEGTNGYKSRRVLYRNRIIIMKHPQHLFVHHNNEYILIVYSTHNS